MPLSAVKLARSSSTSSSRRRCGSAWVCGCEFGCALACGAGASDGSGEVNRKSAASSQFTVAADVSAQLPRQSPGERQPKSESLAAVPFDVMSLEEFLEKHFPMFRRNAHAGVADVNR